MAIRWKKFPRKTGLIAILDGPRGSELHDGAQTYASVYAHSTHHTGRTGWYWVASAQGVPHYNSCNEPGMTEAEAKAAAMAYVKKHLSAQKGGA